jgi:hypothetical protein
MLLLYGMEFIFSRSHSEFILFKPVKIDFVFLASAIYWTDNKQKQNKNSVAFWSAKEIYRPTERAAYCRRSYCPLLRVDGSHVVSATGPHGSWSHFSRPKPLLFIQVAPQLFSWVCVDPVPDPSHLRKSGSAENRTRHLWICSQELWSLDYRGGPHSGRFIYFYFSP